MTVVRYYPNKCSNPVGFPTKQCGINGITTSKNGMPEKFNGADGGASFAMGRNLYTNTTLANDNYNISALTDAYLKSGCSCTISCNHSSCRCKACNTKFNRYSGCNVGKSINVQSSDQHIQRKKNQAIGKGSMPGQTNNNGSYELSFKSQPTSNINTSSAALRRCRNSGYVVPPKVVHRPVHPSGCTC